MRENIQRMSRFVGKFIRQLRGLTVFGLAVLAMNILAPGNAVGAVHGEILEARGAKIFGRCRLCHSLVPGKANFGPNLAGVFGRRAGTVEGYAYSAAMARADIVWNERTLDLWLKNSQALIPGSRMPFRGLGNPEDRKAVIRYIRISQSSPKAPLRPGR